MSAVRALSCSAFRTDAVQEVLVVVLSAVVEARALIWVFVIGWVVFWVPVPPWAGVVVPLGVAVPLVWVLGVV